MKRILPFVLAAALLLSAVSVSAAVLYGDIDNNGSVNNRDLARLQQHLNGWDVTVDMTAADVTDDGRVNNRDLARLQQYLTGWDVQLGPDETDIALAQLPEVGYDIDGRGRVFVESIQQIGRFVEVTLVNTSDKWMTEETSCVLYTCTDSEGNVLSLEDRYYGTLYIGMLEAGERDTYIITLPQDTVKMEFGDYRIIYWSQWKK